MKTNLHLCQSGKYVSTTDRLLFTLGFCLWHLTVSVSHTWSLTALQNSRYQTYQRMWNFMHSKQPSVFVKSTEEGIARVLNSNYAYLLESTMNEYYRQRNCNLTQIGGLLDTKGYGIGMPLGEWRMMGWRTHTGWRPDWYQRLRQKTVDEVEGE